MCAVSFPFMCRWCLSVFCVEVDLKAHLDCFGDKPYLAEWKKLCVGVGLACGAH